MRPRDALLGTAATMVWSLGLVLAGCGRSPAPATTAEIGARLDGAPSGDGLRRDVRPPTDGRPGPEAAVVDGGPVDGGCHPPCAELCVLALSCGFYPGSQDQCVSACDKAWGAPLRGCLGALRCAKQQDCGAVAACVSDPPKPDLFVVDLLASVKANTVLYSFNVCNKGPGASDPFVVDLTYQSAAAPKPKQAGDQSKPLAGLAAGTCVNVILQRNNTPPGTYSSWVQVDAGEAIAESNEANNVAGPTKAVVQAPAQPDLVIKQLDAKVNGTDIDYVVEVCNVGGAAAGFFRVDVYYNRLFAPAAWQIGDTNAAVFGLAPGACQTINRSYKNAPVAIYNSWAMADTLATIAEASETNNIAGPKVVTVVAPPECVGLCTFATGCGVFKVLEFQQCLTWCTQLPLAGKQCAVAAQKQGSCPALQACALPPPPPPPPPPWSCLTLCNYLFNPCQLVPQNGVVACIGACMSLPSTKIQCALDAIGKQQCLPMFACIL